ncbi:MAG: hypothetical protein ACFFC7_02315 [Candidatus Hermodarchaeota archaeon]
MQVDTILLETIIGTVLGVIITGAIAAGAGLFAYFWQERLQRSSNLAEIRKNLYDELIRTLFELFTAKPGPERSLLASKIERGWLFASDNVLRAIYKYLDIYDQCCAKGVESLAEIIRSEENIKKEMEECISEIFLTMRRDIRATKIDAKWASDNVKIYDWGIISNCGSN